ncbi:T9SS type A sorting domain-containing protein [Chryseobacterium sp. MMS23-Vi53]|uniref:T9SS type A sorting domain-containing protein n=1 Tax=Chryseobacterium sp. MMS23-Vi53 TaxID=3386644 RepID=UPI0039EB6C99
MKNNSFLYFSKALLVFGFALNIFANAQQWDNVGSVTTVSAGGSGYNNLAIDASGNYYLSYYDTSVAKGTVQKFDGNAWSYLGGTAGITTGTATFSSLTLDAQGNPYYSNQISYPGTGMEVRTFVSGSWTLLPNVTANTVNYQATAISPSNILFAYSSDGSGTVRKYVNGAWEQVGTAGFAGGATFAEMVIGSDNNIYVCQIASGVKVYRISANATSSDSWTLLGGAALGNGYTSDNSFSDIALDGNNNPYVVYVSSSAEGRKLNVKKFDGNSWIQIGAANFSDTVVNNTAITVGSEGTPYVVASIWDSSNANHTKNSVYKFNSGTSVWTKIGGDFVSDGAATFSDLAIDKVNNYLVLAYSQSGTKVKRISLSTLAVNDIQTQNTIGIYPNPTKGAVNIKTNSKIKSVEVTNTVGQIVSTKSSEQQVDLTNVPSGIYFVKAVFGGGNTIVKKVIKE